MILGVDIGVHGAIACLYESDLIIHDIPTLELKGKTHVDYYALGRLVDAFASSVTHAYVEQVGAMPGQGVSSMFNFGKTYGIIIGTLSANFIPMTHVTPQKWKKELNVPADKDGARARASQLMPTYAGQWPLKKHDGRAEAALLAYWGKTVSRTTLSE